MPNYCDNMLTIEGDASEIDRFLATCLIARKGNQELSFEAIIPIPEGLEYSYQETNEERLAVALCKVLNNMKAGVDPQRDLTMQEVLTITMQCPEGLGATAEHPEALAAELHAYIADHGLQAIAASSLQRQMQYGYDSGYEFCLSEWGTKWNAIDTMIHRESAGAVTLSFATAWSPPVAVIATAGDMFPTLRFRLDYLETGEDFSGTYTCAGDEETDEHWNGISDDMHMAVNGCLPDEDEVEDDDDQAVIEGRIDAADRTIVPAE